MISGRFCNITGRVLYETLILGIQNGGRYGFWYHFHREPSTLLSSAQRESSISVLICLTLFRDFFLSVSALTASQQAGYPNINPCDTQRFKNYHFLL